MKKRMGAFLLLSAVTLSACGNEGAAGQGEAASSDKTTIRFASWDSEETLDNQQALVD